MKNVLTIVLVITLIISFTAPTAMAFGKKKLTFNVNEIIPEEVDALAFVELWTTQEGEDLSGSLRVTYEELRSPTIDLDSCTYEQLNLVNSFIKRHQIPVKLSLSSDEYDRTKTILVIEYLIK